MKPSIAILLIILIFLSSLQLAQSGTISFGRHYPHGNAAVVYLYGLNGTWREMKGLQYRENKIDHADNPSHHPTKTDMDISSLLLTYKDEEKNLLCDFNFDGEIDNNINGWAGPFMLTEVLREMAQMFLLTIASCLM